MNLKMIIDKIKEYIQKWITDKMYGDLTIKFENGIITQVVESIKHKI